MPTLLFHAGFWIPLIICTYLALTPEPPEHLVLQLSDIILHGGAFAYLTLALVLARGVDDVGRNRYRRALVWMLAYGASLELVQGFVPERTPEIKDMIVDCIGISAGLIVAMMAADPIRRFVDRVLSEFTHHGLK